jgi:hypothetical protein
MSSARLVLADLQAVTGLGPAEARALLAACDGDESVALQLHFAGADDAFTPQPAARPSAPAPRQPAAPLQGTAVCELAELTGLGRDEARASLSLRAHLH